MNCQKLNEEPFGEYDVALSEIDVKILFCVNFQLY